MPEGHTLHRLALDQQRDLGGRVLRTLSPQGRFAREATVLDGEVLLSVEARGKHLFYRFATGALVHVHLGLAGRFRRFRQPAPPPRPQVRLRMETELICVDLSGPAACELLTPEEHAALLARLGPDLLDPGASRAVAWNRVKASRRALGALLLDQSVMSGVGNVYRAEGLFLAGLHPEIPGRELTSRDFTRLWNTLRAMLASGVRDRAIITVARPAGANRPPRGQRTWVYRQRTCRRCEEAVRVWSLGSRTMYACERCQRR